MTRRSLTLFLVWFAMVTSFHAQTAIPPTPPYKNTAVPVEQRVADLLKRMTLEEKATMLFVGTSSRDIRLNAPVEVVR